MASAIKLVKKPDAMIDPELKAFIDRVVVPILVQDFLAREQNTEKRDCDSTPRVTMCTPTLSAVEVAR
jgi:hypothetical protein